MRSAESGLPESENGFTRDWLLGGKLVLDQMAGGHRAGTDAVLLVAAAGQAERVVDLGSGVGSVGLGLLKLGLAQTACLVEREPGFAALARANVALNGLDGQATVHEVDVEASASAQRAAGLEAGLADLVIANPPYNEPGTHRASPDRGREAAHAMGPERFEAWARMAARCLRPKGRFTLIHRPEALVWLLPCLARRFGRLGVTPVHARAADPARRVLISGQLNSRAPARILPALVLHEADGGFTAAALSIHAGDARLTA
jgi:tRNA1(Val) A37 N6-methylase TrmN6